MRRVVGELVTVQSTCRLRFPQTLELDHTLDRERFIFTVEAAFGRVYPHAKYGQQKDRVSETGQDWEPADRKGQVGRMIHLWKSDKAGIIMQVLQVKSDMS